jgi:hypothetical protein
LIFLEYDFFIFEGELVRVGKASYRPAVPEVYRGWSWKPGPELDLVLSEGQAVGWMASMEFIRNCFLSRRRERGLDAFDEYCRNLFG